jgi:hypothetical protein
MRFKSIHGAFQAGTKGEVVGTDDEPVVWPLINIKAAPNLMEEVEELGEDGATFVHKAENHRNAGNPRKELSQN